MPIYTPNNVDQYCRIFDANGLEWRDVVMVDTDSGEIEQFVRDDTGRHVIKNGDAKRERRKIPIPISMVSTGPKA